ncbi:CIA30 family protein [Costertonia aggregata]|uniref:CIA30 family protein n=1 Tax=Costertonia aggregata TaxID=343403 RepID=A0A7H9AKL7_9FLAO|nr:CIA30 family protein [Costertonia aggregata]QLG44021.1 CIA30 family protein [Costertonia aggregata]
MNNISLFDFSRDSDISKWVVVNDGVMGGLSQGSFKLNKKGHGEFSGYVSLENNGGFSSIRYPIKTLSTEPYSRFEIKLRGDRKNYQFRAKSQRYQRHSYISKIETNGDWQTITVKFSDMYPAFRGNILDIPNYDGRALAEIAFLIGNKKAEDFKLEIDYIRLQ